MSRLKVGNAVEVRPKDPGDLARTDRRTARWGHSRRLKPQDPARPTDIRVLLESGSRRGHALKLGQKVELRIHQVK